MSALRSVLDRLNDIEATISQMEGNSTAENARAYRLTLQSLEKRRDSLRDELAEISERDFVEVCDYRIIPSDRTSYALAAVTGALHDFQDLVTLLFDVDPKKPKQRARLDPISVEKTRFDFGFSYSGSLGVVLTVPNERLIAIDSDLDEAVKAAFNLISAKTKEDIQTAAGHFGAPAVRKLYSWSKTQRDYGLSADIKWMRGKDVRSEVLVQAQESAEVCRLIENKSDMVEVQITVIGVLVGYNVRNRKFVLELPDGEFISGDLAKTFEAAPRTVPGRYSANLIKRTVVNYVSEKEEVSWHLVSLADLK
jgi:uncharacterized protein YdcH (DUF465 family)